MDQEKMQKEMEKDQGSGLVSANLWQESRNREMRFFEKLLEPRRIAIWLPDAACYHSMA